jgi:hypothetical protein
MSGHQNGGQIHSLLIPNKTFENVARWKHLGTTVTNENYIHEEMKSTLNSGNACYHSVESLKKIIVILPVVSCECKILCLTLREEQGAGDNIWT